MRKIQWQLSIVVAISLWSSSAYSFVDMKSASYSETWTDIASGKLKMVRVYNSRSLFDGMTGYGWCTDFETNLEVVPSGALKIRECGGGMESLYVTKGYSLKSAVDQEVQDIMVEVKKRRSDLSEQYLATLTEDLKNNEFLRDQFGTRLDFRRSPRDDSTYYSSDSATTIIFDRQQYIRKDPETTEVFDVLGRLIFKEVANEGSMRIRYENNRIVRVSYSDGNYLLFGYDSKSGKVKSVTDSFGNASEYEFLGHDLVESKDATGGRYKYTYDDAHNLILIDYPDGTRKELTYNKDKDWVTSFTNQKGCVEKYDYETDASDPKNHFTSTVQKTCNGKVTNDSTYEYIHKPRADGTGVYLQTVIIKINGSYRRITYDTFDRPTYDENNGSITRTYRDPVGRIVELDRDNAVQMSNYDSKCRQPTLRLESSKDQTQWTLYQYDASCRIAFASRKDLDLNLGYDDRGHIIKMTDNRGNLMSISYGRNDKPALIKLEGVGSISVQYAANNKIEKVDSDEGSQVAAQIASLFNDWLDLVKIDGDD